MNKLLLIILLTSISCIDNQKDMLYFSSLHPTKSEKTIRADYFLVILWGQSLSLNSTSAPTVTPSGNNMLKFNGGIDQTPHELSILVPLTKQNDQLTMIMETMNKVIPDVDYVGCTPGLGGANISNFMKGTETYDKLMANVIQLKRIADSEGKTVNCPAIVWVHGENDTGDYNLNYYNDVLTLLSDLNSDIKATLNQTNDVYMLLDQMATHARYSMYPIIALQQLKLSTEYSDKVRRTISMYIGDYVTEQNVHGKTQTYQLMGVQAGNDLLGVVNGNMRNDFKIISHTYNNLKSTIQFEVPVEPLVFDTIEVNAQPDGNKGFKLFDVHLENDYTQNTISEAPVNITNVSIVSNNTIEIVYDSDPSGYRLTYGIIGTGWERVDGSGIPTTWAVGRRNGARGNLRDSAGNYQSVEIRDEEGLISYNRVDNWCPIFEIQL